MDYPENFFEVPTPHIEAKKGDFADFVIMPGDPLRAEFIAENFLENAVCINRVRGMLAFTGEYKGKKISVMGHGMGCPSMGIYSFELFNHYDVKGIIRVGSCGAIAKNLKLRDVIIAQGCCTNSNYLAQFELPGDFSPLADYSLLEKAVNLAKEKGISYTVGNILTSDRFYDDSGSVYKWQKIGVLATEMETLALYANAARAGKKALALVTVSDFVTDNRTETTTSEERQTTFNDMISVALDTALANLVDLEG
ncbi:MAG: purine-nucleoside phosphorylase [Oscillospiraceae bacterium]|jgi:purine-nucleoside phosphorylase|nr:purine-nucleoside phosphorylase [Oscillospiraceae bacterium]